MTTLRKITLTVLIAGLVAGVAGLGALASFSATTSNTGNSFASGTVAIGDNDGGSTALYTAANQKPDAATVSCIRVTYTGSLASNVALYASPYAGLPATNGAFHLTVERGTQSSGIFPACGDFAPTSTPYDGTLAAFPTSYATGIAGKAAAAAWATNDVVAYRFTINVVDDTTANAHTAPMLSGSHDFTWEARNN
jgi:predicted ribosomally synthesized peptide with SipW-like signal peptide